MKNSNAQNSTSRLSSTTLDVSQSSPLQGFKSRIRREFLDGSKIDAQLFESAIEMVSDTEVLPGGDVAYPIHEALNWHVTRFGATARENLEAVLFKNEDRSTWQAKLSRSLDAGKKPYLAPKGKGSQAFTPAITVQIWVKIAQRYKLLDQLPQWVKHAHRNRDFTLVSSARGFGVNLQESSFWQWVRDHETEIILTEGGKKSLCLLSRGYVAIALYGCDGGRVVNDRIAGEIIRKLKPELIPDLKPFATPGREFVFAFDQDAKFETRYRVSRALDQLGQVLIEAGCKVKVATWDGQDGKGIDDLIVHCGAAGWENAHAEAETLTQWRIEQQLAQEVRRRPTLNIGDREFVEVASELPKSGITALHGGKGSGKSKAIGECLKLSRWLSITHLTSLGRDQAVGWSGVFANDGDRHGSKLLKDGVPVNGGSVCVPSLLKVAAVEVETLVLDEVTATLEFLLGSKLANKNGIRPLLLSEFVRRVKAAKSILIADADLTEEALHFIEEIRGERAYLVRSERKALTYDATVIDGSNAVAIALLQSQIAQAPDKIFYINTDAKTQAETLAELLGKDQALLITGDTSGGEIESALLSSKGRDLPNLLESGIRYIISSPSIVQGFSFEHHTDLIDSVWGFYSGCSISAHAIAQAPDRVRDSGVPRFFSIAKKGSAYSRLSQAQSVATFLKEFKQLNTTAARLVAHSLMPDVASTVEGLDWQSQNLQMLAAIEVRRNRGMGALRETLIALLRKEGKHVLIVQPHLSKSEISAIAIAVNDASERVKNRHCEAVAAAKSLTKAEADAIAEQSEPLTPEQVLSLERFYIGEFYRLEDVSVDAVSFDRNGRTRSQIKALEAVLSPDLAEEITTKSIHQNPENPQDWNPLTVKVWLLEQSGAAALIRQIAEGEVTELTSSLIASIAEFIRSHATEFRIAFHFRNIAALSDQQIIGEILTRHGIKTKRRGKGDNLRYAVQATELEAILEVIHRRKKAVTPPLDQGMNQRGATSLEPDPWADWKSPEEREWLRKWWRIAQTDPEQAQMLRSIIPNEVLEWAISQTA